MAHNFGQLVFTPVIKALQERYGSRRQDARMEESGASHDRFCGFPRQQTVHQHRQSDDG